MPAKGAKAMGVNRQKVYVESARHGGVRVPFGEVPLSNGEAVRLYDTSGPGSEPTAGLPPLRRHWILERGDVEEYEGRPVNLRDDGRGAVRRGATGGPGRLRRPHTDPFPGFDGERAVPLRAKPGSCVTQMH